MKSQELSQSQLELALVIVNQAYKNQQPLSSLLLPSQLKHLSQMDWEILDSLYVTLEAEKAWSQVH